MPAVSKAQKAFFGIVDKVQRGELSPSQVTDNIRRAAKDYSQADVQDYVNTPAHELPDRTVEPTDDNQRANSMKEFDTARKYLEGGDPPADAVSPEQANFFRLVDKVQKGEIPSSKVTSQVRQAAKNTARADVRRKIATDPGAPSGAGPDTNVPSGGSDEDPEDVADAPSSTSRAAPKGRGRSKRGRELFDDQDITAQFQSNPMKFHEIVAKYNEYGRLLKRERKLSELAQQFSDIAEYAEYALTAEADDWFDSHTIRRNIKEMKKYAKDFSKVARDADAQHERLVAYYEDMGRILERYFEIAGSTERQAPQMQRGSRFESYNQKYAFKAIQLAESKIPQHQLKKFRSLPENVKAKVAWRIL